MVFIGFHCGLDWEEVVFAIRDHKRVERTVELHELKRKTSLSVPKQERQKKLKALKLNFTAEIHVPGEVANFSTSFQGPDTTAKIFISALGKLRQNKLELSILSPFSLAFLK